MTARLDAACDACIAAGAYIEPDGDTVRIPGAATTERHGANRLASELRRAGFKVSRSGDRLDFTRSGYRGIAFVDGGWFRLSGLDSDHETFVAESVTAVGLVIEYLVARALEVSTHVIPRTQLKPGPYSSRDELAACLGSRIDINAVA